MTLEHETIIYGMIDAGEIDDDSPHHQLNRQVIAGLPDTDDMPFLTVGMFSVTGPSEMYGSQIIHFAASMKALEPQWHLWLAKFEDLLRRLYWFGAVVHLESELFEGDYQYQWIISDESMNGDLLNDPIRPVSGWEFTGGPRVFDL